MFSVPFSLRRSAESARILKNAGLPQDATAEEASTLTRVRPGITRSLSVMILSDAVNQVIAQPSSNAS